MIGLKEKPKAFSLDEPSKARLAARSVFDLGKIFSVSFYSILTTVIVLLLVELLFSFAHVGENTVVAPDALLGYGHLANQTITTRMEGYSRSRINAMGFRDRDFAIPKPKGVQRIAIMGDSVTLGLEVSTDKTFAKLLEKKLHAEGRTNIEVMNCGTSGYGTGQEYLMYINKVVKFQPDMVIVSYHLGDSDDNSGSSTNPPRPVFGLGTDGRLIVDFSSVDAWLKTDGARYYSTFDWLRRSSRIVAVLNKADLDLGTDPSYKMLVNTVGKPLSYLWSSFLKTLPPHDWKVAEARAPLTKANEILLQSPVSVKGLEPISVPRIIAAPAAPNVLIDSGQNDINLYKGYLLAGDSRTSVTKAIIRDMNTVCKKQGTQLVIAAMPAFSNSIFYVREVNDLRKFSKQEGITFVDSWKSFTPRDPMADSPEFFGLHFNCKGHQIMCDTLYQALFAEKGVAQNSVD